MITSTVFVGTVVAVDVRTDDIPDTVYAEEELTVNFEVTALYTNHDEWTLKARTLLALPDGSPGAEWTVEKFDSDGNTVDTQSFSAETIEITIGNQDEARISIQANGIVPFLSNHEEFDSLLLFEFTEISPDGGETKLKEWIPWYKVNGTPTSTLARETPTSTLARETPTSTPAPDTPVGDTPRSTTSEGGTIETPATSEGTTQSPDDAQAASNQDAERQRGFLSNEGNEPDFLSNPFNLTTLGFLLSVAGIIHQMMGGQ